VNTLALLKRYGIQPAKGLGQNFLVDEGVLDPILAASALQPGEVVLEVGPGLGLLTRRLVEAGAQVVAVELDERMVRVLRDTLGERPSLRLVTGDILARDPVATLREALPALATPLRYKVVANLPYYITSAAFRHLLGATVRPERLVVMVQREVAERIIAPPGQLSLLALSVQIYGQAEIVARVPASAFYPPPKVESAVLCVRLYPQPLVSAAEEERFFRIAHAGFGQKRKQLHNSLCHGLRLGQEAVTAWLERAAIAPTRRAQTLSIAEWLSLSRDRQIEPRQGEGIAG
jgi:16S rRNA (adenine1518-N6/adenine1519-N6)-dimethyltransferase